MSQQGREPVWGETVGLHLLELALAPGFGPSRSHGMAVAPNNAPALQPWCQQVPRHITTTSAHQRVGSPALPVQPTPLSLQTHPGRIQLAEILVIWNPLFCALRVCGAALAFVLHWPLHWTALGCTTLHCMHCTALVLQCCAADLHNLRCCALWVAMGEAIQKPLLPSPTSIRLVRPYPLPIHNLGCEKR